VPISCPAFLCSETHHRAIPSVLRHPSGGPPKNQKTKNKKQKQKARTTPHTPLLPYPPHLIPPHSVLVVGGEAEDGRVRTGEERHTTQQDGLQPNNSLISFSVLLEGICQMLGEKDLLNMPFIFVNTRSGLVAIIH
jgi:hypothetical protein